MQLTWLDSNSWLIEMAGQRILLDPWLVGSLTFGNQSWLFRGDRRQSLPIPANLDLILLSQGLEDHAHPPTLTALDHSYPVVGSPTAAQVVKTLGYENINVLKGGESLVWQDQLKIQALPGSPIGPNTIENAYLLTDLTTQETLYYEPHGYHSPELENLGPVTVVITPVMGISILGLLPVLKGQESALQLCRWLQPQFIVPTAGAADIDYSGFLTKVLRLEGGVAAFKSQLHRQNPHTAVPEPQVGIPFLCSPA